MYHYVYRITNTVLKKYYYGARSSINLPIEDIGINYFSSSKNEHFMSSQKNTPSAFKYKVVKTFETRRAALLYETFLHNKFNVAINASFYSDNTTFKQERHNKIILDVYKTIGNMSEIELESIKNTGLLEINEFIKNNILGKDKDIIHLSNEKIMKRKILKKYFNLYKSDIEIINNRIKKFMEYLRSESDKNGDDNKYLIKLLFDVLIDEHIITNQHNKQFKRCLYEYFKYLLNDIESYDPVYRYGNEDTTRLNSLTKVRDNMKYRLDLMLPLIVEHSYSKYKLKKLEIEYRELITHLVSDNILYYLQIVDNKLISLDGKSISQIEDLGIKYMVCKVMYDNLNTYIKSYKMSLSSKKCLYSELYI